MGASERISLARALHDGIAQDLVALRFRIEYLAGSENLPTTYAQELRRIALEISSLTAKVREELFDLHHPLQLSLADEIRALAEIQSKSISFKIDCPRELSHAPISRVILSMTDELIRNTLIHARATHIEIAIAQVEGSVKFLFSDNGVGGARERKGHFGLIGIRESVELLGGSFDVRSEGGTKICALFPIPEY